MRAKARRTPVDLVVNLLANNSLSSGVTRLVSLPSPFPSYTRFPGRSLPASHSLPTHSCHRREPKALHDPRDRRTRGECAEATRGDTGEGEVECRASRVSDTRSI